MKATARLATPSGEARELEIWPSGQMRGDLGDPRLNQRVAQYAEAVLDKAAAKRPHRHTKSFDQTAGAVEIEIEFELGA
jgi:hypothetical protein